MTNKHRLKKTYKTITFTPHGMPAQQEKKHNGWQCIDCGEQRRSKYDFNEFDCEEPNFEVVDTSGGFLGWFG